MAEGFAVRRIPFGMHQGEFAEAPRCPLWGWCSAQRIEIAMIAGGNHTSVSCRAAAKGVPPVTLSRYHSTSHTPSVSLAGSEEPSSLPAPPPGSRGIVRIRPRFHKNAGAHRTPQPLRRQLPFQGRLGDLPFGPASSALHETATPAKPFRGAFLAAPFGGGAPRSESR